MPPRKRERSDKTPSPTERRPDPAPKQPKQDVNSRLTRDLAPKPSPQNHPPPRQSTTYSAPNYAVPPTSFTQGGQAGGLSGAGLGYGVSISSIASLQ